MTTRLGEIALASERRGAALVSPAAEGGEEFAETLNFRQTHKELLVSWVKRGAMEMGFTAIFFVTLLAQATPPVEGKVLQDQEAVSHESVEICRQHLLRRPEETTEFSFAHDKVVTVRHVGVCEVETQVTIYRTRSDEVKYQILLPKKGSIRQELLRLDHDYPELSVPEACDRIEMRLIESGPGDDAAVGEILSRFERLKISPTFDNIIYLHGHEYEIWATAGINQIYYTFQGSGSRSRGSGSIERLERWSQDLLDLLGVDCDSLGPILGHDALP